MTKTDNENFKKDVISYVKFHEKHYLDIFKKYDATEYKNIHKNFMKFFNVDFKKATDMTTLESDIKFYKELFLNIHKNITFDKSYTLNVMSMNVYLECIIKTLESSPKNSAKSATKSTSKSVVKSATKSGSRGSSSSVEESQKFTNKGVCNATPVVSSKCTEEEDDSCCESSGSENGCCGGNQECGENLCDTDVTYPFSEGCGECCDVPSGCVDGECCSSSDVIEQFCSITKKLEVILSQICMLNVILCELRKEFISKINCFALCDQDGCASTIDVDYENNMMWTTHLQIDSLITKNNCLFTGTSDKHQVKIYLCNGKSLVICTLDNLKFSFEKCYGGSYILVYVGSKSYKLNFLTRCMTNSAAICVLKQNFCTVKMILMALESNRKVIEHWLNLVSNMGKCKKICQSKKDDCKCDRKCDC